MLVKFLPGTPTPISRENVILVLPSRKRAMRHFTNTDELVTILQELDYSKSGLLGIFSGQLDVQDIEHKFRTPNWLSLVASRDGFISKIRHSSDADDHSARTDFFDYHCDGAYLNRLPDICVLYCTNSGAELTPTYFVDTRNILKRLSSLGIDAETLRSLDFVYRGRSGTINRRPLATKHPYTNELVLNCCVGIGNLKQRSTDRRFQKDELELGCIWAIIQKEIRAAAPIVVHWTTGACVVWDNHTYLHARMASSPDHNRELVRFWYDVRCA
jgi:hypothetical protein